MTEALQGLGVALEGLARDRGDVVAGGEHPLLAGELQATVNTRMPDRAAALTRQLLAFSRKQTVPPRPDGAPNAWPQEAA